MVGGVDGGVKNRGGAVVVKGDGELCGGWWRGGVGAECCRWTGD